MLGLEKKVVLVTGGAGGIGAAICARFADLGAVVGVADVNKDAAESLVSRLKGEGKNSEARVFDITDYEATSNAVMDFEQTVGEIDVLVHCAGWDRAAQLFLETTPESWDKVIDINLRGSLNILHVVAKCMAPRKEGSIINLSSDAARSGAAFQPVYAACKNGLVALTKSLAIELARYQINVNVICPGVIQTELTTAIYDSGDMQGKIREKTMKQIPLRRLGEPSDIAGLVAFLASDDASYITGQVVSISGGMTMAG